jgi:ATP-dependent Zn protease
MPKNLLLRPGRLTESLRLGAPSPALRESYVKTYIAPLAGDSVSVTDLVAESEGLSFAHLTEMRQLAAALIANGGANRLAEHLIQYCKDQIINGDRHGGYSVANEKLQDRVKQADPRLLVSALQMTDVFKRVIDSAISKDEGILPGVEQ